MHEIDARTQLAGTGMVELLLFRLGQPSGSQQHELFAINVFKVREILVMPEVTFMAGVHPAVMGVANVRGQMIPVINLPAVVGCEPTQSPGILLVTEFARTIQAFAVEEVSEIVRLDWKHMLSAEGTGSALVTSFARLDGSAPDSRMAQVLDVEQILQQVLPRNASQDAPEDAIEPIELAPGAIILAADDSVSARRLIEQGLKVLGLPYVMTHSGQQAWDLLQTLSQQALAEGKLASDKVALVLSDLEMPEMDGFTLTRKIKQDARFKSIPVVIHSSLTGTTNEAHVRSVGADGYVAKFAVKELAVTLRQMLSRA